MFPFYKTIEYNIQNLWFQSRHLCNWFKLNIRENKNASNAEACDTRDLLKLADFERKSKYFVIIYFLIHALSIPVSVTVWKI